MRFALALLLCLSTFGIANAQSYKNHPWVFAKNKVVSTINNNDFFSRITLEYYDRKVWLLWEFNSANKILSYKETYVKTGRTVNIIHRRNFGNCPRGTCITKTEGKKTWIAFPLKQSDLNILANGDTIHFRYELENLGAKSWTQRLKQGAPKAFARFKQAMFAKQAKQERLDKRTDFSDIKIKLEKTGKIKCSTRPSRVYEGKTMVRSCRRKIRVKVSKAIGYKKLAMKCVFKMWGMPDGNSARKTRDTDTEKFSVNISANGTGSSVVDLFFLPKKYGIFRNKYQHKVSGAKCDFDLKLSVAG